MSELLSSRGVSALLHAAFLWDPVRDTAWVHEVESVGTDYVLAAVLAAGVRKLVVASSMNVYGVGPGMPTPVTEDAALAPEKALPPFRDRVAAEQAVARFAAAHPGVCTTVLRPACVLAPDVDRVVPRVLGRSVVPVLMGFDPLVQFLHPEDALLAFLKCLSEDHPGVYNLAPPDAIALSDVLRIGRRMALPLPHFAAVPGLRFLWTAGIGDVHPSFLEYQRFSVVLDGTRARERLGFEPARTTAEVVEAFYREAP
jgi:UDP-glucose 4-epimerase